MRKRAVSLTILSIMTLVLLGSGSLYAEGDGGMKTETASALSVPYQVVQERIGPSRFGLTGDSHGINLSGLLHNDFSGDWVAEGELFGHLFTHFSDRVWGELLFRGTTKDYSDYLRTNRFESGGRINVDVGGMTMWTGIGGGGVWDGSELHELINLDMGMHTQLGSFMVSVAAANTRYEGEIVESFTSYDFGRGDSIPPLPVVSEQLVMRSMSYTDTELNLSWSRGNLGLGFVGGFRIGDQFEGAANWMRFRGTWWVSNNFALVLESGRHASSPEARLPEMNQTSIAMTFNLAGRYNNTSPAGGGYDWVDVPDPVPNFAVERQHEGLYMISVNVSGAASVEVSGDFTDWNPVSLVESHPGHWQVDLKISSGTHRISISINGDAWEAPPGLTPVNDEFGRTVSVLVID